MKQVSDNILGAALMTGSMVAFTVNDAFMKALATDIPLFQAVFLRGIGVVVFLFIFARITSKLCWKHSKRDWALIGLRSVSELMGTVFFLQALFHMPIANISAILQVLPLSVTLAGAVFLNEPLGWRRLLAVLVGFVGVFLIIRPDSAGFDIYSIYALGAVVCVTVRDLTVRRISREVPSIMIGLCAAVVVMVTGGLVTVSQEWAPVLPATGFKLAGAMICLMFGYVFSVAAMRHGDISFVAPFRYSGLVAALLLGWFVFADWPTHVTLLGAAIVVGTGLFTLFREGRLARKMQPATRLR